MSDLTGDVPAGYVWEEDVLAGAIDTSMAPVNACRRYLSVGVAEEGRVDKYRHRCRMLYCTCRLTIVTCYHTLHNN